MATQVQASELIKIFAANVRNRRKELGITQAELADRTGCTQPRIAQIEAAKGSANLELLAPLAVALGTTPGSLITPEVFLPVPIDGQ